MWGGMKKFIRTWHDANIPPDVTSIDDLIALYERNVEKIKVWRRKGIILDARSKNQYGYMTFTTADPEIAADEGFEEPFATDVEYDSLENIYAGEDTVDGKYYKVEDGYKRYLYKVGIVMKSRATMKKFSRVINAIGFASGYDYSKEIGASLGISSYRVGKKKITFQLWTLRNEPRFHSKYPVLLEGCGALLYFYHVTEPIDRDRLKLIESALDPSTPIVFIGYGDNLPDNPEQADRSHKFIVGAYPSSKMLYISMENPASMVRVLDRLSRLILGLVE